jgi:Bacterial PH domain
MKFPSKQGFLHVCTMIRLMVLAFFIMFSTEETIIVVIILALLSIRLIVVWFSTYYVLTEKELHIYSGYTFVETIELDSITSMNRSYNPFVAPAISFKRIQIMYGKWNDSCLISPQNKEQFLQIIQERNLAIKLDKKLSRATN